MRNGNSAGIINSHCLTPSSPYPTYEEWKHPTDYFYHWHYEGPYPTYEEWKQKYVEEGGII